MVIELKSSRVSRDRWDGVLCRGGWKRSKCWLKACVCVVCCVLCAYVWGRQTKLNRLLAFCIRDLDVDVDVGIMNPRQPTWISPNSTNIYMADIHRLTSYAFAAVFVYEKFHRVRIDISFIYAMLWLRHNAFRFHLARITNDMYFAVADFGINLPDFAIWIRTSRQMPQERYSYAMEFDNFNIGTVAVSAQSVYKTRNGLDRWW